MMIDDNIRGTSVIVRATQAMTRRAPLRLPRNKKTVTAMAAMEVPMFL